MIRIRKARKSDVRAMVRVLLNAYHKRYSAAGEYYAREEMDDPNYETTSGPYYSHEMFVRENARSIRERLGKPFKAFVMLDGKKVIGYAITENHLGRLWVNDMVVMAEYQKKGLGRKLFRRATGNRKNVYVWVNSRNPALGFWKKLGFREQLRECLMVRGGRGRRRK